MSDEGTADGPKEVEGNMWRGRKRVYSELWASRQFVPVSGVRGLNACSAGYACLRPGRNDDHGLG